VILRVGLALSGGQFKPLGGFLLILDHAVAFGVAQSQFQLRVGVACRRTRMRQVAVCLSGGGNDWLFKCKPSGDANQHADSEQQHNGFDKIEFPEVMPAVTTVKGCVQQDVEQTIMGVKPGSADLRAPTVWADGRHGGRNNAAGRKQALPPDEPI
jgi:hypothetical protein